MVSFSEHSVNQTLNLTSIEVFQDRLTFLNRHMLVQIRWFFSICQIYWEYRTAGHLVFYKPWPAVDLRKVLSVTKHGFVFWAQRKPNARLEIYKAFDSLDWLGFLAKSNLLKIPDCRSFSVLKTLTGYRSCSHSLLLFNPVFNPCFMTKGHWNAKEKNEKGLVHHSNLKPIEAFRWQVT